MLHFAGDNDLVGKTHHILLPRGVVTFTSMVIINAEFDSVLLSILETVLHFIKSNVFRLYFFVMKNERIIEVLPHR